MSISAAYSADKTVARVTDLVGVVFDVTAGSKTPMRILARVRQGSSIQLAQNASLILHFSATRTDFSFIGPTTVRVMEHGAISENGISSKKEHRDVSISLDLKNSDLGGVIARSIQINPTKIVPTHPVNSKVIADKPVTFTWDVDRESNSEYQFELTDQAGIPMYTFNTTQTQITLSNEILLTPGQTYQWVVASNSDGVRNNSKRTKFFTATLDETDTYYRLSTLTRGTVSDLVLYALTLDELNLTGESYKVWQRLESYHPGISNEL
jgi:hypothetical protein